MWLVFVMYGLFASIFTVGKATLEYGQPFFILGSRMTLAGFILLSYQWLFQRQELRAQLNVKYLKPLLVVILFNFYLTNIFEFWGLQYLDSSKACFIYNLSPFISALISYFAFSEKMTFKKWIGLSIGCIGMMPILLTQDSPKEVERQIGMLSWPEIALLFAVFCSCYGWTGMRQLRKDNYSPITANGLGMIFGGIFALLTSLHTEQWNPVPVWQWRGFLEGSIYMMIVSNLLAYNLYSHLLRRFTVTFMSFAGFVTPLFASFYGWLFLQEQIKTSFFLSAGIVFCGLYLFYQQELQKSGIIAKILEE